MINYEVSLTLTWYANCVITKKVYRKADSDGDPAVAEINASKNAAFSISDTKLYVPLVTILTEDDNNLLQQLKTGFRRKNCQME